MNTSSDAIRRTAILIDSLDPPAAELLLDQLPPVLAAQLRAAVFELADVGPEERDQILSEFLRTGGLASAETACIEPCPPDHSAVDAIAAHPPDASQAQDVEAIAIDVAGPGSAHTVDTACRPEDEHAQAICRALTRLPRERAVDVLRRLTPCQQDEVLRRLARLDPKAREMVGTLREALAAAGAPDATDYAARVAPTEYGRTGAISEGGNDHPRTRDARGACRHPTGPEPQASVEFDDLVRLDDVALARVLADATPEVVLLALSGAHRDLLDRITSHLPSSAGRTLRRQLETLGPTRLSDIESAQQRLAELAGRLARSGLIRLPGRRRFTMAA